MLVVGGETRGSEATCQSWSTGTGIKWILKNWRRGRRLGSAGSGEEGQVSCGEFVN